MLSLDPDDFLADVAEDREDSPSLPFPATEKVAEEEELEWLSNKDAFPAVRNVHARGGATKPYCQRPAAEPPCLCLGGQSRHWQNPIAANAEPQKPRRGRRSPWHSTSYVKPVGIVISPGRFALKTVPKWRELRDSAHIVGLQRPRSGGMVLSDGRPYVMPVGLGTSLGGFAPSTALQIAPTFSNKLHSNAHRKVMQIRKQKYGTVSKPADKCVATSALTKSKKNLFPAVTTVNILEQPSRSVIAEEQSPVSVLENSSNSSTTFMSFSGPLKLPQQPPSKFLRQQLLFCNRPNNHNQEDTTKVEIERNSTILKSSFGTLEPPYKAPSEVLGQQQLVSYQPNNKRKKKDTAEVEIEGNSTTFMSSCGTLEPPHQAPSKFLDQQQLFYNQPNKKRNNKNTAKVETAVKPVDKCTTTLMKVEQRLIPSC
ncbi:hypothetical protein M0R45_018627 [Rubus argutus]|uniref:Uncharacterized protein n=1 Tax=Rubus argutus TaxID=59490 RepID=A0AAW1X6U9_RUBAR